MSRTIRRKHSHSRHWHITHVDKVDAWDMQRWNVSTPQKVVIRQTARFHSDAGSGSHQGGVPHWFRRHLNKRVDRANKEEIFRCVLADCWEDFLAAPHVSNADWYW